MDIESRTPHTRRALLAATLGGIGAFAASALGRISTARAAAGDNIVIGAANDAGSSQTTVLSSAPGATITVKDSFAGGTGLFGWSSGTSLGGRGLYGRADSPDGFGLQARNNAASNGAGAAIQAIGGKNTGVDASTSNNGRYAVRGISTSSAGSAIGIQGELTSATPGQGSAAIRGTVTSATNHGTGVVGSHSGSGTGVFGSAAGDSGHGVLGLASGSTGRAVQGDATGSNGIGVYGSSTNGLGVEGTATSGGGVLGGSSTGNGGTFVSETGIGMACQSMNNYAGSFDGPMLLSKHLDISEMLAPANAPAGTARLFARDNGVGKTQLCLIFPSGVVQVLATEA